MSDFELLMLIFTVIGMFLAFSSREKTIVRSNKKTSL